MLASCCDLIMAADDARFADRAVRWGGAHVQYFGIPWDLGPRKAKEYLFTGDYIDAEEACPGSARQPRGSARRARRRRRSRSPSASRSQVRSR